MDRRSWMREPAAGKENASSRPLAVKRMGPQTTPAVVPKTPKARAGAASRSAGRGGRGSGLSLRADGNGGAPTSALRTSAAAASALRSSKRQGEDLADTSTSSSDFTGPQRVRVSSSNPPDLSLSFWPAATPDNKTSRLKSKTASRAARTTTAGGPAVTPLHHHHQAPGATPREPSTVARDTAASSSRRAAGSQQQYSSLAGGRGGGSTRKRARPDAAAAAAAAPAAAAGTSTRTSAEARQQASRGGGRGGGAAATPAAAANESSTAAVSSSASTADPSLSYGTDISHILNWKPAPRPNAAATGANSTANSAVAASVDPLDGRHDGGGACAPAPAGHQQRRQLTEQPAATSAAAANAKKEPATAVTTSSARPASASSAAAGGGLSLGAQTGAGARPRARVTPTPSATASTAARPRMHSSLEALRVRVVRKADDDDDDDDDDDSFEVDLKLEAYDAEIRRRSADAGVAPRLAAVGNRSMAPPAEAEAPSTAFASKDAAASAAAAGVSGNGDVSVGRGEPLRPPAAAKVTFAETPVTAVPAPAATRERSNVGGTHVDSDFNEGRGNGGSPSVSGGAGTARGGGEGKLDGGVGVARELAGAMDPVPEEDGDLSITIGTGSKVPFPTTVAAANAIADGGHGGTGGGGSSSSSGATPSRTVDTAAATHDSIAAVAGRSSGCSGSVSLGSGRLSSPGPVTMAGSAGGTRGELTPPLGSEQTDTSISSGGGGDGGAHDASATSGLLGASSTGGSVRGSGSAGNPEKAVAFAHAPKSNWSEMMVNGVRYLKTAQIGRGGSSKVFRVVAPDCEMKALKVVKVDNRVENAKALLDNYSNEIKLLKSLQGNRFIINLENSEVDRNRGLIFIVLELGETDLDQLLRQYKANIVSSRVDPAALGLFPGGLDANFVRVIWQQMLKAVQAMHDERVVHGDLKPANFVFVKGSLKLIDFGIAKAISNDTTNISRDARLGTMNYMCPEAFEDTGKGDVDPTTGRQTPVIKQGRASDIWSLGCILYQMAHGKTPFSHLGMIPKIRAITNPNHAIAFAELEDTFLVQTLRSCLERDPLTRAKIGGEDGLLSHPYLHPIAARASLEKELEAKATRAQAQAAELERALEAREDEQRRLALRHEEAVAAAVAKAVAAEQARQAAGMSIAKSALKHIIATTVRVLNSDTSSGGRNLDLGRDDIDRITGLVIDMGRGGGGGGAGAGAQISGRQ